MVELLVAVVELIVQVFLTLLQLLTLAVELIGGVIALVFERLDRGAAGEGTFFRGIPAQIRPLTRWPA